MIVGVPNSAVENIKDIVMISLFNPDLKDETKFESLLGVEIPSINEIKEIGIPSKLYQTANAMYFSASILTKISESKYDLEPITFILTDDILITVTYTETSAFKQITDHIHKIHFKEISVVSLFVNVLKLIVDYIVEKLEEVGFSIDAVNDKVFNMNNSKEDKPDYQAILGSIGLVGDIVSKTRESLTSLNRVSIFMLQSGIPNVTKDTKEQLKVFSRDISALNDYASFSANKVNFLLDATLGMINIEQNSIIKIFSVASVVFLPPTLIASIYGMNFHFMPELRFSFGYPIALTLMILSSWLPYKYFKHRKWL